MGKIRRTLVDHWSVSTNQLNSRFSLELLHLTHFQRNLGSQDWFDLRNLLFQTILQTTWWESDKAFTPIFSKIKNGFKIWQVSLKYDRNKMISYNFLSELVSMDWMYWNMFIFQTSSLLWAIWMRWIRIWRDKMLKWQQAMFSAYLWYFGKRF